MSIGNRIIYLRENNDVKQADLAHAIDMSVSVLSRIENDERAVRDDELSKIAKFFNVSADYLLGRPDNGTYTNPYEQLSEDIAILARGAKKLSKKQIELINNLIEQMNEDEEE